MISVYSVLFALVLLSGLSGRSVTVGVPASKLDDGRTEQESLGSLLDDEAMKEDSMGPPLFRRSLIVESKVGDEDGKPKFIIFSSLVNNVPQDTGLEGPSMRGLNPAFTRGLPPLMDQRSGHTPAEYNLKVDRRDTDIDVLRCMIGRVYRPCWQS
ncbi:pro-MCH [Myripristis murdjan]|uniref:pro-MCH n=1 Tax=Myripristis murdjan TaxID=586833 RepID=UPI0011760C00|nr:pro-MCH 2-like [Myripristis murdjan]